MNFIIDDEIAARYPELMIGVLLARNIENLAYREGIDEIIRQRVKALQERFSGRPLSEEPLISSWRETYRSFGAKPKKFTPTVEALVKRAVKGNDLPQINTAVNCYLATELKFLLPVGGYDLSTVTGDIRLKFAAGGERFLPLGAEHDESVDAGEVIYLDDKTVLTRKWNYRDAEHTKITPESRNILLFTESNTEGIDKQYVFDSLEDMKSLILQFCGGSISFALLYVGEALSLDIDELTG